MSLAPCSPEAFLSVPEAGFLILGFLLVIGSAFLCLEAPDTPAA